MITPSKTNKHKEYWKPEEPVKEVEVAKTPEEIEEEAKKPKITMEIEGGAKRTTTRNIMLNISAKEERGFGISGYLVSEDKTPPTLNTSGWVVIPQSYPLCTSFATTIAYTLDPKDGMKTIYVWCRDGEGYVSHAAVVSILLTSYEFIKRWGKAGTGELEFTGPSSMAQSPDGGFYIVDTDNHRVSVFDKDFNVKGQLGEGRGKTDGKFYYPRGVAADQSTGDVYIVDSGNNRVQKFDSTGKYVKQWGCIPPPPAQPRQPGEWHYVDGNETTFSRGGDPGVELYDPLHITVDKNGEVWVVDSGNHRIKRYDREGTLLSVWGVQGSLDGMLHYPCGIVVDDTIVYVADMGNNRVQLFDKEGKFIKKWGKKGTADGQFKLPLGMTQDPASGHFYVADSGNHRVQRFDKEGNYINSFGLTGEGEGEFNGPVFVAIDRAGYIYVLDRTNAQVQKFKYVPREEEGKTN